MSHAATDPGPLAPPSSLFRPFLSVPEAAEALDLPPASVRELVALRILPATRTGKAQRIRIPASAVDEYAATRQR
jgi:excisionase family DNA binding protein